MGYYSLEQDDSFKDLALKLKEEGIKNYAFMLYTESTEVALIDPWDPDLTEVDKLKVITECTQNIWYFLRKVLKVKCHDGSVSNFTLNKANCAQVYCNIQNKNTWVTTPRQIFRTGTCLAIAKYLSLFPIFEDRSRIIKIFGRNVEDVKELRVKLKELFVLPDYFINFENSGLFSNLFCSSAGNCRSLELAKEFGRTESNINAYMYFNETEFIPNIGVIYSSLISAHEILKSHRYAFDGYKSFIMLESVINDDEKKSKIESLLNESLDWKDTFYDLTFNELSAEMRTFGSSLIHIQYNYIDLGKDKEWFDNMCTSLMQDEDMIRRELLLKRKSEI